jgi:hypothetical protein
MMNVHTTLLLTFCLKQANTAPIKSYRELRELPELFHNASLQFSMAGDPRVFACDRRNGVI